MPEDKSSNKLITTWQNLQKYLLELDPNDVKVQGLIILAIQRLTKEYVIPAMQFTSLQPDSFYTFDLDSVAGMEIHNLARSLFEIQFTGLTIPSNAELSKALSTIGINDLDEGERNNFYKVWAGEEAITSILCLIKFFLSRTDRHSESDECTFQREKIGELLKLKFPIPGLNFHLETILESLG